MRIINYVFYGALLALAILTLGFIALVRSGLIASPLPSNFSDFIPKAYIVQSGSMEPAIKVGSIVIVQKQESYSPNDVITFGSSPNDKNPTTHRIYHKDYPQGVAAPPEYLTAGDANEEFDRNSVRQEQIIGKVVFTLPYAGYIADFAKRPQGFILLVIVPATIIIYEELKFLKSEFGKSFGRFWTRVRKKKINVSINLLPPKENKPLPRISLVLLFLGAFLVVTSLSLAYFFDIENSIGNIFGAGEWGPPPPGPGDIVINEIMWMGTQGRASDEWIELRNMTGSPIDLSNWSVVNVATGPGGAIVIPAGKIIPANGYFVISNRSNDPQSNSAMTIIPDVVDSSVLLQDIGEQLTLKDASNNTIDAANGLDDWFAGENGQGLNPEMAMERNSSPGDGTLTGNWHDATVQTNIDLGGREIASPGSTNSPP